MPARIGAYDADAIVAWSTSLRVQMQAQTHSSGVWRRRGNTGEGWELSFMGSGFALVQPSELLPPQNAQIGSGLAAQYGGPVDLKQQDVQRSLYGMVRDFYLHVPAAFVLKRRVSGSETRLTAVSAAVEGKTVLFTTTNWNTPQTVTVTGVDDSFDEGDLAYMVVTGAASGIRITCST